MSKEDTLRELIIHYTNIFNLEAWKIELRVVTDSEYSRKHGKSYSVFTDGCTEIYQDKMRAKIYVKDSLSDQRTHDCILHEMIHIPINDLYVTGLSCALELEDKDKSVEYQEEMENKLEQAVSAISQGILIIESKGC